MPSKVLGVLPIAKVRQESTGGHSHPFLDEAMIALHQNAARTVNELNSLFAASGAETDGLGPTNAPSPTGITVIVNQDGSMNVTLTWNYTQGPLKADNIVVFWKVGTAPLTAPTAADKAIGLIPTATSFTFEGVNPNNNFRFGVAAARRPTATSSYVVGVIQSPTAAPDWADISATGNYTNLINGTAAVTVVSNAADGKTAFDGTPNYRTAGAPSNNPSPTGITSTTNTDGSIDYILIWSYTQGTRKADGFLVFVKDGNGAPVDTDPHFQTGAKTSGTFNVQMTLKGYPIDKTLSFGVSAFRRTDNALEIGAIQSPTSNPDWQGISSGTPLYLGKLIGAIAHGIDPSQDTLFHFDGHRLSTQGLRPTHEGGVIVPDGKFGACLESAEGTTNDMANGAFESGSLSSWTSVVGGGGTTVYEGSDTFGFPGAVRCSAPTTSDTAIIRQTKNYGVEKGGTEFTVSAFVKILNVVASNPVLRIVFLNSAGTSISSVDFSIPTTDRKWTRYHLTQTAPTGTQQVRLVIGYPTAGQAGMLLATGLQLEEKGFRTPYVNGTRALTSLRYNRGVPSAGTGAFFCWVYVFAGAPHNDGNGNLREVIRLMEAGGSNANRLTLRVNSATGIWQVILGDETGATTTLNASAALSEGWHSFAATWDKPTTTAKFYIDGALVASSTTAKIPLTFMNSDQPMRIGGGGVASNMLNSRIDELLFLPRVPSADEIKAWHDRDAPFVDPQPISPTDIPNPPTNSITPSSVTITQRDNGTEVILIGWNYTQPAFVEGSLPADYFLVAVKEGNTSTPHVTPNALHEVGIDARNFSFQAPVGQTWSFSVAAVRRTQKGPEIGAYVTSAASPDWQGIGGNRKVQGPGIEDGSISNQKISDVSAAKINTGLLTVDPSGPGANAIVVKSSGKIEVQVHQSTPATIDFTTSTGSLRNRISAAAGNNNDLDLRGEVLDSGTIRIGNPSGNFSTVVQATSTIRIIAGRSTILNGHIWLQGVGSINNYVYLDNLTAIRIGGAFAVNQTAGAAVPWKLRVQDIDGTHLGWIQLYA